MVSLSSYGLPFCGIFRNLGLKFKNFCYKVFTFISFALLLSSRFNIYIYFRLFSQTTVIEMLSLNRYEKVICENCGTKATVFNLAHHEKRCSAGILYCTQYPNFSTKSQNDMNYHFAKKHSAPKLDVTFKRKPFIKSF